MALAKTSAAAGPGCGEGPDPAAIGVGKPATPAYMRARRPKGSVGTVCRRSPTIPAALLKMTFNVLRNVSVNPRRIGSIVAAALVLLHFDHARAI
jgi:hypothetical protein